jgi:hypothetical protein
VIFKHLCEKSIIEKFQELPKIDIVDLRILTVYADKFIKGEPLKVNNPLAATSFYIGNRKITRDDISKIIPFQHWMRDHYDQTITPLHASDNRIFEIVGRGGPNIGYSEDPVKPINYN